MKCRLTQQDIARMAGVSQATVSLVLNNRTAASARIAAETRERVLQAIRETGYVADPLARRLLQQRNQILGVFTYEPVFPSASARLLPPVPDRDRGVRRGTRLRPAAVHQRTGRRRPPPDLPRGQPAAARRRLHPARPLDPRRRTRPPGRRGLPVRLRRPPRRPRGPIPYVGADYPAATATVTARAVELGHRRLAFVGPGEGAESSADRLRGFQPASARRRTAAVAPAPARR